MKILVVSPTFLPAVGGAELVILEVFRRLAEKHEVRLLTVDLKEELSVYFSDEYDEAVNFRVDRFKDNLSLAKLRGHRITGGIIPPFSISAISAVKESLREFRPDIMNLHYVVPTGLAAVAGKLSSGVPLVVTYNGRDVPGPGIPFFWKYWNRLAGNFADEVTFVSEYCRDAIFGKGSKKGVITYNGVNVPRDPLPGRSAAKKQLGIKEGQKMIFSLGRLNEVKRIDILVKAMSLLKEKRPDLVLYIAGKGHEEAALKALVKELALEERIKFLGFVPPEKLGSYFAASEFFVFHSRFETFGMVLAEAMSWGRACVSVDSTAISEVAPDGECALLARVMDASDMAEKINSLLSDEKLRNRLEGNARKRAEELFDWEKIATEYENVFLKVLKHRERE
ncbi:MAG: glycosyltransferase family 4 protein [Candidatus Omnitrophota bacterium]